MLLGGDNVADPLMKQVAQTQRTTLQDQMSPEDRTEAENRAVAWRKAHAPQQ
jgi:hypothetical protein